MNSFLLNFKMKFFCSLAAFAVLVACNPARTTAAPVEKTKQSHKAPTPKSSAKQKKYSSLGNSLYRYASTATKTGEASEKTAGEILNLMRLESNIRSMGGNESNSEMRRVNSAFRNMVGTKYETWMKAIGDHRVQTKKMRELNPVPVSLKTADDHFVKYSYLTDEGLDLLKTWVSQRDDRLVIAASGKFKVADAHYLKGLEAIKTELRKRSNPKKYVP